MATYNGTVIATPVLASGYRRMRTWMGSLGPMPAATIYYYRTSNGSTRGTAATASGVPAGSVIERITR